MKCSQCGRPAIGQFGNGYLLCVEHFAIFNSTLMEQQRMNMAMMNYLHDQMDDTFGLPHSGARINIPRPVINSSPVTYNNISVDRSVIGAVNTAQVRQIDVALDNIKNGDASEVSEALRTLTEATIANSELAHAKKNQLIEQLAFLAEQATLPKDAQQRTIIKSVLKSIPTVTGTVASLTALWAQYGPQLEALFKR